jgi:tRNA G10  N-methylase Trm11
MKFKKYLEMLPTSIINVGEQKLDITRRERGFSSKRSSRSEYSYFSCEIAKICTGLFFKNCTKIFDPFAGWGDRHYFAKEYGYDYIGYDINPKAIEHAKKIFNVDNTLADSFNDDLPSDYDAVWSCPPYWNLEQYTNEGIDGCKTWEGFLDKYFTIIKNACRNLSEGGTFCFYVGDWRNKGVYYDLTYQTQKILSESGMVPFDMVIGNRKRTKISIMIPQAMKFGYTVKVHETLLVYKKPPYKNTVEWEIEDEMNVDDLFE